MKTRFLKEVKNHKMTILKDDGVYRHIRFKQKESSNCFFDLITYPGHLVISGDMGDYIFARNHDMFSFFSTKDNKLNINLGYWTEKLKSISTFGAENGIKEFCRKETFKNIDLRTIHKSHRKELKRELFNCEDERDAVEIMDNFNITDAWEYLAYKPTFHIQWILYAIKWGILKYEKDIEKRLANLNKIKKYEPGFLNTPEGA